MKRIGLLCFLGVTAVLLLFHQAFLARVATLSLHAYSLSKWGQSLEYDALLFDGTQLTITRPRLENHLGFQAEKAVVDFAFDWGHRTLNLSVAIAKPRWVFQQSMPILEQGWEELLPQEESWIKVHQSVHLSEGHLTWHLEDPSDRHEMRFDLTADSSKGALISLSFDSQNDSSNQLELRTISSVQGMEVNCKGQTVSCRSLQALADLFALNPTQWKISSGTLQGELKALFPVSQRPYLEGDILLESFVFDQNAIPLHGVVEEARLTFEKNQSAYDMNSQASTIVGTLTLLKPALVRYQTPDHQWSMNHITGSIKLNGIETALIQLEAQAEKPGQPSKWILEGMANLNAHRALNLDLTLLCSSLDHPEGKIHLKLFTPKEECKRGLLQLQTVSYAELDYIQTLLATFWPHFKELELKGGVFDAVLEADVTSSGLGEIRLKQFIASGLNSKVKSWNAQCNFDCVRGYGRAHLGRDHFWDTVQAGWHFENGSLDFEAISPELPFTDIQGHLLIQKGQIENSLVTLQLAGLKGKMDVEWGEHKQFLIFKLDGVVEDLADLFPHVIQKGLKQHFYRNRLMVLANFKNLDQKIELGGTLHIQEILGGEMDTIHFGCELKKQASCSSPQYTPSGWFYARKLPVEKYLSPFIFRDGLLHMEGDAEFKGSFDDEMLTIKYDADDLMIENEDLRLEIKHLHAMIPGHLIGSHRLDLKSYQHEGTLPIQHATYYEKNSGLLFQDIQGIAEFKQSEIRLKPFEANCEGVAFSGELVLDYADPAPGVFNLKIQCPVLSGKISQIQRLLAHLEPTSLLHQVPLEGEVTAKGEGLKLDFAFIPEDYHLNGDLQGMITDGAMPFLEADVALRGIDMDVEYRHRDRQLEFSDIQGACIVGKPQRAEEFQFSGHHIRISQLADPNFDVDFAVKDHDDEIFRVSAYTKNEETGVKSIHVNPQSTHVSCIYPQTWKCRLVDWSRIEQFEFISQFNLNTFFQDLTRFRKTGLFNLSHCVIDKLAFLLPISGRGAINLQAQSDQSYSFQFEGKGIKQGKSTEHYALLKGSKQDKKWIIDQLQWDDWSVFAELLQTGDRWKIPFLGLNIGQNVLLGLEGDLNPNEGLLHATLNFCEFDLDKLDRWDALKPFVAKWHPKGVLKAEGEMEWSCLLSDPMVGFKASLIADTTDLAFRNYPLQAIRPFHIDINGDKGFIISDAQMKIPPSHGGGTVNLEKLEYQPIQDSLGLVKLLFDIPPRNIPAVGESLHYHFPDLFDASLKNILTLVYADESFKGSLEVENRKPDGHFLQLKLDDGTYGFKNRKWPLKQFEMHIAGGQLNFSTFTLHERCPLQVIGWMNWPGCQSGQTTLLSSNDRQNLLIKWAKEPNSGYAIKSIKGNFCGCDIDLSEDLEPLQDIKWKTLAGRLSLDFNGLCPLLPMPIVEKIQKLKLGSAFMFKGHFWMDSALGNSLLETAYFKGLFTSQEAIVKGYGVQDVQADLQYVPGRLDVQNLVLTDPAGTIRVPSLIALLDPKEDSWSLFVPSVSVRNLRVSLLRDVEGVKVPARSKFHSLIIKRIDLRDLSGELDRQETWQAKGNLHFANPSRKNLLHPLFAIPGEIILRLGLDPNVLNPVTGSINFNLQGDRFYLTKLKDVYSEGRGSKFYLAQGHAPSWMDLEGNLSVQIRMKQYNVIFKIAELFTVSVQGNILKPRYTLHKQPKSSHKQQPLPISSK